MDRVAHVRLAKMCDRTQIREINMDNDEDIIIGENDVDNILDGGNGKDRIEGLSGNDILNGDNGKDSLFGGDDNDTLNGGRGKDLLEGGEDNDILNGGHGKDSLSGDEGADVLNGGRGNDLLEGGEGNDKFEFGLKFGKDTILDFEDGDLIDLSVHGLEFDDLKIIYANGDAVISNITPGGKIIVKDVADKSLDASDFDFLL